jgi:hypothetical protein
MRARRPSADDRSVRFRDLHSLRDFLDLDCVQVSKPYAALVWSGAEDTRIRGTGWCFRD